MVRDGAKLVYQIRRFLCAFGAMMTATLLTCWLAGAGISVSIADDKGGGLAQRWELTRTGYLKFTRVYGQFADDHLYVALSPEHGISWYQLGAGAVHPAKSGLAIAGWVLPIPFSIMPMWCIARHFTRKKYPPNHCVKCNYDLRAHSSGDRCPECGAIHERVDEQ
jgi:hypothetical protein